jgi:hypothetical protein
MQVLEMYSYDTDKAIDYFIKAAKEVVIPSKIIPQVITIYISNFFF